jgi:hypothetical protein
MRSLTLVFLSLAACVFGQTNPVEFEGRPGILVANDKLELTILVQGGSLASLVLRDDPERLSPLWNPIRMAREADMKPPAGFSVGHFVCVDGFGPVSPEEQAVGMPGHGEAHTLPWEVQASGRQGAAASVTFRVELPLVQEVFTRAIRMIDGENVVYVESELENLLAFDRPVCWAEHATIGSPFLEPVKTVVDMSAQRSKTRAHPPRAGAMPRRLASFQDFAWPMAPAMDGSQVDLRSAPANPRSTDHTASLVDTDRELGFVTALHKEKGLLLGYVFRREEYPWVQNWENYPPTLKMARGLEFSTQPFDVPRREVIQFHSMFGAPAYRWLPAKKKIRSRFLIFYTRVPEGFERVDDVKLDSGRLIIEDRGAGKVVETPASEASRIAERPAP